mmetsp:Transcript_95099/g.296031  ORF Transcript_95099/g.296031 Transcript_95099/m.296031 type:complete len:211 (+) Transcript_95099:147-779(+)
MRPALLQEVVLDPELEYVPEVRSNNEHQDELSLRRSGHRRKKRGRRCIHRFLEQPDTDSDAHAHYGDDSTPDDGLDCPLATIHCFRALSAAACMEKLKFILTTCPPRTVVAKVQTMSQQPRTDNHCNCKVAEDRGEAAVADHADQVPDALVIRFRPSGSGRESYRLEDVQSVHVARAKAELSHVEAEDAPRTPGRLEVPLEEQTEQARQA